VTALDNGFATCDDPVALQSICDRLGPAQIQAPLVHHARLGARQHDLRPHRQPRRLPVRPPQQLRPLGVGQHELGLTPLPARHLQTIAT
jgi:hypothetical protein